METSVQKVLFVCLGNICRSPLAEGVFRHQVDRAGLGDRFIIDSAGTASYHVGEPPDSRTASVARARGVELIGAARQLRAGDLTGFDYVVVMDRENLANVLKLAKAMKPTAQIRLLREFDEEGNGDQDVPDPYYGGAHGFEHVHDIVERACARLLEHIRQEQGW